MAASRYLFIERTALIATGSFFSLSKHSKTCPKIANLHPFCSISDLKLRSKVSLTDIEFHAHKLETNYELH
ncbi:hypothetical protein HanXRQr2_Chr11g0513861 [Helianthus annuus]|uniref:Uncharacterized protein n=1 Tax=Helianthus annuus TaxID=4232 RepID=A0A9K3HSU2_HELAN|nr:hypothetical protein HanXRQr2_Chr11g0513861 [Helianthus annuus]